MKALVVLSLVLFFALPARADSPSGQELNRMMQQSEGRNAAKSAANDGGDFLAGAYDGYILGVSDGMMGTSLYYYCPPSKIDKNKLRTVVSHYLKTHQRDLHVPAGALVAAALIEAYPCRKKSQEQD